MQEMKYVLSSQFVSFLAGCPLDSNYCENGGTCVEETTGNAMCECPDGYTGQYCEIGTVL